MSAATLSERILSVLSDGRAIKSNKLRKTVFKLPGLEPNTTWDDFKDSLDSLIMSNTVSKTIQPKSATSEAGEVVQLTASKRDGEGDIVPDKLIIASAGIVETLDVPAKFVPFMLRQRGQKLKNIEVNSKTRIMVSPNDDNDEADATRKLTISGNEEKHLKTARVLLSKMVAAFTSHGKPDTAAESSEPKGNSGKGGKGGKGKGSGKGKGGSGKGNFGKGGGVKGRGKGSSRGKGESLPYPVQESESGGDTEGERAQKRTRKFY